MIKFFQSYFCPGFINKQKEKRKESTDLPWHTQIPPPPLTHQRHYCSLNWLICHDSCTFYGDSLTLFFYHDSIFKIFHDHIFKNFDYVFLTSIWKTYCWVCEIRIQRPTLVFIGLRYYIGFSDQDMRKQNIERTNIWVFKRLNESGIISWLTLHDYTDWVKHCKGDSISYFNHSIQSFIHLWICEVIFSWNHLSEWKSLWSWNFIIYYITNIYYMF